MFKKSVSVVAAVLIIIVFILSFKLYNVGDIKEREKIIYAVTLELAKQGYTEEDLHEIYVNYNPYKGGVYPYDVFVVFKESKDRAVIYNWKDKNKQEVEKISSTSL